MSDRFSSKTELRRYVETELKHAGIRDRPDLSIAFQNPRCLLDPPPVQALWWTIESSKMDQTQHLISRHYLLEARYDERQFVIWFGTLTGFQGSSPRNVIRPAVHLIFPEQGVGPEEHGLGAVISWMLEHEDHANASWDPMVFPLSGGRY
jgi:hypothetical protein